MTNQILAFSWLLLRQEHGILVHGGGTWYKIWGEKVRELPLGESTQLLWNNRNSEAITMMEQRCHLTVQQQGQFLAYMCDSMCLVNFFWSGISCAHASHQKKTELSSTPCFSTKWFLSLPFFHMGFYIFHTHVNRLEWKSALSQGSDLTLWHLIHLKNREHPMYFPPQIIHTPDFLDECKFWRYVRTSPHKFCICNQTSSTVKVRLPIHAPHLTLPRQLYLNKNIWAK